MDANQLNVLMQAVLDGTATPQQVQELDNVLAADAGARAEFESWRQLFKALAGEPMAHPPEGLVAAISAAVPSRAGSTRKSDQLFLGSSVLGRGQQNVRGFSSGFRTTLRRMVRPEPTQEFGQMNVNRKIWGGAAFAVVALGVAAVAFDYPPKSRDLSGTIAPAERYRAPQSGADAIKLGDQSIAQLMQTDAFDRMVKDPELQVLARNQDMRALAQFLVRHADVSRQYLQHFDASRAAVQHTDLANAILSNVDAARSIAQSFDVNQTSQAKAATVAATADAQRAQTQLADLNQKVQSTQASKTAIVAATEAQRTQAPQAAELQRLMLAHPQVSLAILSNVDVARSAVQNIDVARTLVQNADASRYLLSSTNVVRALSSADAQNMVQSAQASKSSLQRLSSQQ